MSYSLRKLAFSIINANSISKLVNTDIDPVNKKTIKSIDSIPTEQERLKHETSTAFGEKIDFSVEPSTEYLD